MSDDTLIYSREVPDTKLRGTWLKIVGRTETGAVDVMKEVNLELFATRNALFRMKPDGSELKEVAKLSNRVESFQPVEIWGE